MFTLEEPYASMLSESAQIAYIAITIFDKHKLASLSKNPSWDPSGCSPELSSLKYFQERLDAARIEGSETSFELEDMNPLNASIKTPALRQFNFKEALDYVPNIRGDGCENAASVRSIRDQAHYSLRVFIGKFIAIYQLYLLTIESETKLSRLNRLIQQETKGEEDTEDGAECFLTILANDLIEAGQCILLALNEMYALSKNSRNNYLVVSLTCDLSRGDKRILTIASQAKYTDSDISCIRDIRTTWIKSPNEQYMGARVAESRKRVSESPQRRPPTFLNPPEKTNHQADEEQHEEDEATAVTVEANTEDQRQRQPLPLPSPFPTRAPNENIARKRRKSDAKRRATRTRSRRINNDIQPAECLEHYTSIKRYLVKTANSRASQKHLLRTAFAYRGEGASLIRDAALLMVYKEIQQSLRWRPFGKSQLQLRVALQYLKRHPNLNLYNGDIDVKARSVSKHLARAAHNQIQDKLNQPNLVASNFLELHYWMCQAGKYDPENQTSDNDSDDAKSNASYQSFTSTSSIGSIYSTTTETEDKYAEDEKAQTLSNLNIHTPTPKQAAILDEYDILGRLQRFDVMSKLTNPAKRMFYRESYRFYVDAVNDVIQHILDALKDQQTLKTMYEAYKSSTTDPIPVSEDDTTLQHHQMQKLFLVATVIFVKAYLLENNIDVFDQYFYCTLRMLNINITNEIDGENYIIIAKKILFGTIQEHHFLCTKTEKNQIREQQSLIAHKLKLSSANQEVNQDGLDLSLFNDVSKSQQEMFAQFEAAATSPESP